MAKLTDSNDQKKSPPRASEYFGDERRDSQRLPPEAVPSLQSVCLSRGPEVQVINISRFGALLESEVRLPPRIRIFLRIVTTNGVIQLAGRVLRSEISGLKGVPRYQSAIAFEEPFRLLGKGCADVADGPPAVSPESVPPAKAEIPANQYEAPPSLAGNLGESAAILTLTAVAAHPGSDLHEMFGLNDW